MGSFPGGVIGIFQCLNPSHHTVVLDLASNISEYQIYLLGVKVAGVMG